jgi:hypothetical protein
MPLKFEKPIWEKTKSEMRKEDSITIRFLHPPTQETPRFNREEECVTLDGKANSDYSTMLRRISLTGG